MAKSVESISRALKLKAESKQGSLTLKLGAKKLALPFEVRCLSSSDYVFVHIPPAAGVMKFSPKGLALVESVEEAQAAASSFRQTRKRSGKKPEKVALPPELASALNKIPAGYKLAYDASGAPRLVKTRNRGKKKTE